MGWFNTSELKRIKGLIPEDDYVKSLPTTAEVEKKIDDNLVPYSTTEEVIELIDDKISKISSAEPDGGGPESKSFFQLDGGSPQENYGGTDIIDMEGIQ
jgi:hypothetical protein